MSFERDRYGFIWETYGKRETDGHIWETDGHIWETDGHIWETDEYVWETVS